MAGANPAAPTTARSSIAESVRDMDEMLVRFQPRRPILYNPGMEPEYKRKIREAEEWDLERKQREAQDQKAVKVPNMERIPFGCLMWIVGAIVLAWYLIQKLLTK